MEGRGEGKKRQFFKMEVDYTWSQSTPSQILVVPKHQSHPLHFYHNDKNNVRFDNRSEPYLPRCRTEDPVS